MYLFGQRGSAEEGLQITLATAVKDVSLRQAEEALHGRIIAGRTDAAHGADHVVATHRCHRGEHAVLLDAGLAHTSSLVGILGQHTVDGCTRDAEGGRNRVRGLSTGLHSPRERRSHREPSGDQWIAHAYAEHPSLLYGARDPS